MKKIRIINFGFIAFCILLAGAQLAFCAETFQNNLLKADVYKSPVGGIKVTLFTSKPYGDSVVVNKKNDFEYVILMPETSNSMTAKPSLKFVDDVVKNIEIKTQQYNNQVKGYTKIVISTTKPVEINSQVQTLKTTEYKFAESDYKELFSQSLRNKANVVKKETAKLAPKQVQKQAPTSASKPASKQVVNPIASKSIAKPNVVTKSAVKIVASPKAVKPEVEQQQVVAPVVKEVKQNIEPEVEQKAQQLAPQEESKVQPAETVATAEPAKKSVEVNNAFSFGHLKQIIKNNSYTLLGALLALFLLLLLVAKKINRNQDRQKEIFTNHLDEKPETITNFEENITEDMTWKEKFQTYVDASQALQEFSTSESQAESAPENLELDHLFSGEAIADLAEEDSTQVAKEDELSQESFEDSIESSDFDEIIEEQGEYENASLDDLFGEEETESEASEEDGFFDFADEEILQEAISAEILQYDAEDSDDAQDEFVQSEFAIDDEKGFYLVDFDEATALVGHIGEEIFVLKRFEQKVCDSIQARFNEKKGDTESYMTKVGDFRALVEVTPEKMNLLIEL